MNPQEYITIICNEKGPGYLLDQIAQYVGKVSTPYHLTDVEKQQLGHSYVRDLKIALERTLNIHL